MFIEQDTLPARNRGARRTPYWPYMRLRQQAWRLEQRGEREVGRALRRQMKTMPSRDAADPGYRRLRYCRYADDWVLGFTGPRQEAEEIKARIGQFLREQLKLELERAKTLITHGRTQAARFLGYEMVVMHADDKHDHSGHRSINGDRAESARRRHPRQVRALPALELPATPPGIVAPSDETDAPYLTRLPGSTGRATPVT